MTEEKIFSIADRQEERFLRRKTPPFSFSQKHEPISEGAVLNRNELGKLISRMHRIMKAANGIGLAANQIGLPYRLFVAAVPDAQGRTKFYAVLNPSLEKKSEQMESDEEGCLSVPELIGSVERHGQVVLKGYDKNGRPLKIKAWGLLARVFQHEVDHLDGKLFIDRASKIHRRLKPEGGGQSR